MCTWKHNIKLDRRVLADCVSQDTALRPDHVTCACTQTD